MSSPIHTTDRFNMAERIRVSVLSCFSQSNVCRVFDTCCHSSDYQRAKEIT